MMEKTGYRYWFYKFIPLLLWFLLLVLPFITAPANIPVGMRRHFITQVLISNTLLLGIFYLHTYLIFPLLQSKGWVIYTGTLLFLLTAYWLYWFCFRPPPLRPPHDLPLQMRDTLLFRSHTPGMRPRFGPSGSGGPRVVLPILSPLIALLCSFCYRIIIDNAAKQQVLKERETIHLRTELNFLRSQINPHFLFNILNNLTSLARKKSEQMEPAIVNLSQLMRYMLYESDDNKVSIKKEIDYLKSYIDLQLLRFGTEVTVKTDIDCDNTSLKIGPMLLIALVENAFKHGPGTQDRVHISINLKMIPFSNRMYFSVTNNTNTLNNIEDDSGIGFKNLKRRLVILYPDKHKLTIINKNMIFITELTIDLS